MSTHCSSLSLSERISGCSRGSQGDFCPRCLVEAHLIVRCCVSLPESPCSDPGLVAPEIGPRGSPYTMGTGNRTKQGSVYCFADCLDLREKTGKVNNEDET